MDPFGFSFERPDLGRTVARRLYQRGADVVLAGGMGSHARAETGGLFMPSDPWAGNGAVVHDP